jgi:hypothetical protein
LMAGSLECLGRTMEVFLCSYCAGIPLEHMLYALGDVTKQVAMCQSQ